MVNWVLRGAVLLWAVFFTILGAQGLLDPATYTETFGIAVDGAAANTVRADLSAFFLVAAGSAAIGALVRGWTGALLVPAALYGTALAGRLIGAALGDAVGAAIVQAMIIEALSVALMAGSWWVLSRPAAAAEVAPDTVH
ncbi:hypothetical protein GCM10009115_14080 [Sphingopyxis soli]|uniref:DUF4345 domain-containing protein n=1 Tax=Sphingopyxis soli TaxID=592051 RepID=A0ABN1M2J5_9SPHN|nr:hypothetical protein [Sphingopyxis soli]